MLSEQEVTCRERLTRLEGLEVNPYPAPLYPVNTTSKDILTHYEKDKEVVVAGRLIPLRVQGKASFATLRDSKSNVQLYFSRGKIYPDEDKTLYDEVFRKLLDLGDFIGVEGYLFIIRMDEKTVMAKNSALLSKVLRPLPMPKVDTDDKMHDAFTDPKRRYRMYYMDLIVNPQVREVFIKHTKLFNTIHQFLSKADCLEVETPVLQAIPGGASARPFVTHHNALDTPLYMRITNEFYLKRLIIGGFDGVYEFSESFRNEGMDRTHNPELTAMEIYAAYRDYSWMMDSTECLLEHYTVTANDTIKAASGAHTVDFKAPHSHVTMTDATRQFTGFNITGRTEGGLRAFAHSIGIVIDETMGKGKLIGGIFGEKREGNFIQPTFIADCPKEMSPPIKEYRDNPELAERFELMVCGKEIINAYSELNDPIDRRERFEEQLRSSEKSDDEAMFIDQDFLRALEYGMPPVSGLEIGMDRLIMFLTNNRGIQEVLFFPQMRPEKKGVELSEDEKVIFGLLRTSEELLLGALKEQAALPNRKWDKAIEGLASEKVIKVAKEGEELLVELAK